MLRWAAVPALAFVLAFGISLVHFTLDDDGGARNAARAARPPAGGGDGRLVVTYTPAVDDAGHGYLGSLRLDGSDLRNVIEPAGAGGAASTGSPSLSPDGRSAAFQRAMEEAGKLGPPFVYAIPLDGSQPERRVTDGSPPETDPVWSPVGRRIAFARQVGGSFDLLSVRPDGTGERRLTDTPGVDERSPAWSPDGTRIAFARYESGLERGSGDLWTADAGGGHERMLLGDEHDYSEPAWSPDGRRIALLKDSLVAVVDAGGGVPRPLTSGGDFKESRPSWSPDGSRLAFTRDPGKILTMDSDGSGMRQVPFDRSANGVDWVPS
jgi:Tol biopolymer transport system component